MKIVSSIDVTMAIDGFMAYSMKARKPHPTNKDEIKKDHRDYIIGRVLPVLYMSSKLRRIVVEAYLAGMEKESDGSSVVPEGLRYGYIKDFQGVTHDYIFWLHEHDMPDSSGHKWTLNEANQAYRDLWIADGQLGRGWLWYAGLSAGSWFVWNRK